MFKRTMATTSVLVLACIGLYAAGAALVESFEYKFDTKDGLEGWTANGESKVEWQQGGANNGPGCMKLSVDHASVDGPQMKFTCADHVISFDYFVHGGDSMRLRVSVAGADNRTKYGRYGNLMIRKVEPDKWHHAEVKLLDIPGMAEEGKAKAFPELEYERIGLCSIAAIDDGYILIDNVKMGKPAAAAAPAADAPAAK